MSYEHITCDLDGSFMIVTLNRPEKLNAYTGLMGAEIANVFARAGADVSGGAKSFDTSGCHGAGIFEDMPSQYPWWPGAQGSSRTAQETS